MANLFDTIKNNLSQVGAQPIPQQDNTQAIQTLARGATGKETTPGSTPRLSNLAEQVATNQANLQQQEQQQKAKLQAAEIGQAQEGQAQQEQGQQAELDERSIQQQEDYSGKANQLLRQFEQNKNELDLRKDAARLEQLGVGMRLADDKYTTNLRMEGQRARLDNEASFDEAIQKAVFSDEMSLFNNDLQFRSMMRAKGRDFEQEMKDIDFDFAMKLADTNTKAENQKRLWAGIGKVIDTGAEAYKESNTGRGAAPAASSVSPSLTEEEGPDEYFGSNTPIASFEEG